MTTSSRWQRVKELFNQAIEMDTGRQNDYLAAQRQGKSETVDEVRRMIAADKEEIDLIEPYAQAAEDLLQCHPGAYLTPGTVLEDRFEIVRFIGRGGMGEVYEAIDRLGRNIALKIINPSLQKDLETSERFRKEVQLAQRVSHPNVCRIHALFVSTPEGIPVPPAAMREPLVFLTMELLNGITLRERIDEHGAMRPDEAMPLVRQMADGLSAAHSEQVIHRDFKPANILLIETRAGRLRVKITDFGLAGETVDSDEQADNLRAGTPDYMAPEQLLGMAATPASDIFAFGIILHEILTGQLPFAGSQSFTEARLRWREPAQHGPIFIHPSVPRHWRSAIRQCLSRDPNRRPTTPEAIVGILSGKHWIWPRRLLLGGLGILASGGLTARYGEGWLRKTFFASPVGSVAVFPFDDQSASKEFGPMSSGLSDELIAILATIPNLRVVARSSVNRLAQPVRSWREAATALGVQAILTGYVRREGSLIRVGATLLNGDDGAQLWTQTYDHPAETAATLPSHMSSAIATALRLRLTSAAGGGSLRAHSTAPQAYESYLLGKQAAAKRSVPALLESIGHFEKAVALDARYALAWAGLAEAANLLAGRPGFPPAEWSPTVERAARRALEIDPHLAEAHLCLGSTFQRYYWNWDEAEHHFQLAVQLAPGLALGHHWYAGFLSNLGYHDRALDQIREARELDPLSLAINNAYGAYLERAGKPDEAIRQLQLVLTLEPKYQAAYGHLGLAYERKGMWDEAIAYHRKSLALDPDDSAASGDLAYALGRAGRVEEARRIAQDLAVKPLVPPSSLADVYKGLGDKERVFELLETAYALRDTYLMTLNVDKRNDIIRNDPRFVQLVARLKLP